MENIEIQRELLGLPEYVFPAALLVFGYPTEQQKKRKKPERFAMNHIVFENRYHRRDRDELTDMIRDKSGNKDPVMWLQAFCERKYNSGFAREMSRSVGKYLEQYRIGTE